MAKITNYPDKGTVGYAELWSADCFIAATWYGATLTAEKKGDERGIGATFKLDVPAACFAVWQGTLPSGARAVQLISVGSGKLENPPGSEFLPVYSGVNVIEFTAEPAPEPGPEPEPEPPSEHPPQLDRVPYTITVYGANTSTPLAHWWGDDLVFTVPHDWYLEAWENGPKKLLEKLLEMDWYGTGRGISNEQ